MVFLYSLLLTLLVAKLVISMNIADVPNRRSSHAAPVPTAGGIAIIVGFLTYIFLYPGNNFTITTPLIAVIVGGLLLAAVGLIDDVYEISFIQRLIIQFIVCALILKYVTNYSFTDWKLVFLLLLFVGFVNAYNFFDGLNGLASSCALITCIFISLLNNSVVYQGLMPGLIAFLIWNLQGKLFQGDVGTMFVGFCLPAFILLDSTNLFYNILLTGYLMFPMLFDVSFTIGNMLYKKNNITQPHKNFIFHKLLDFKLKHLTITFFYSLLTLLQGMMALMINWRSPQCVLLAYIVNLLLYTILCFVIIRKHKKITTDTI